jgi:Pathogenicity locus
MKADICKNLQVIPGIGKCLSADLYDLGYRDAGELRGEDPQSMYEQLSEIRNCRQDRCVLYVFRCAVYFVENSDPDPELLKWWNWKEKC